MTNPRYLIVRASTTLHLAHDVDPKLQDGVWECSGAPFYDPERREWCQAIVRRERDTAAGTVNLREPRRRA